MCIIFLVKNLKLHPDLQKIKYQHQAKESYDEELGTLTSNAKVNFRFRLLHPGFSQLCRQTLTTVAGWASLSLRWCHRNYFTLIVRCTMNPHNKNPIFTNNTWSFDPHHQRAKINVFYQMMNNTHRHIRNFYGFTLCNKNIRGQPLLIFSFFVYARESSKNIYEI